MTTDPQERIEALALSCLDAFVTEGEAAVDRACAATPGDKDAVVRLLHSLARVGLLEDPAAEPETAGQELGDFRLLRRLGGGGMGIVWLAEQKRLRRRVALKLLRPGFLGEGRSRERFRREVAALSRLDHPGICTVYEAGELDGAPYLAMRYLEGESLAARLARRRATASAQGSATSGSGDVPATLVLIEKLARALHHAHQQGLVHRDVKPGNVMLTSGDEPVLLDFGLVRDGDSDGMTQSGDALGTPAYMAPEQVRGEHAMVDARTDVYGLGVTLYECLTGCTPFQDQNRESLYRQILGAAPADPRRWNQRIGSELSTVVLRALEKDPRRRFGTAQDLAEELRRLRQHEPIHSRRPGPLLRGWRWCQRNPGAASVLLVVSVALLVSLFLLEATQRAEVRMRALALALAAGDVGRENPTLAFKLAREGLRRHDDAVIVERLQEAIQDLHEVARIPLPGQGRNVLWSPDATRLVVSTENNGALLCDGDGQMRVPLPEAVPFPSAYTYSAEGAELYAGCIDGRVRVFASRDGALLRLIPPADQPVPERLVRVVRLAPDGSGTLLVAFYDGVAGLWHPDRGRFDLLERPGAKRAHPDGIWDAAFAPDGQHLITTGGHGEGNVAPGTGEYAVRIWSRDGSTLQHDLVRGGPDRDGHRGSIWRVACAADRFATASHDCTVRLWTYDGRSCGKPLTCAAPVYWAEFDASGERLAFATHGGAVRVVDREGGHLCEWQLGQSIPCLDVSPDGERLATVSWNQQVQVWTWEGREVAGLRGHEGGITGVAFASSQRLASAGWDGTARIWSLASAAARLAGHTEVAAKAFALNADGSCLATVGTDGELLARDAQGVVRNQSRIVLPPGTVRCRFASDGRTVVLLAESEVVLWDVATQAAPRRIDLGGLGVNDVVLLPGGDHLVVASADELVQVSLADGQSQVLWPRPGEPFERGQFAVVALTPLGDQILAGHASGTVLELDRTTGKVRLFKGHGRGITALAVSRDGRYLVTGSADNTARVWDRATGAELRRLEGHQGGLHDVQLSSDGRRVVTASMDRTLRVWDAATGACRLVLRGHRLGVRQCAFRPDGRRVLSCSVDGWVRTWWVEAEDLRRVAEDLGVPELDEAERRRFAHLLGR